MLPIRLGMVNAKGPQELFVYALTRNGRVETTNYRTAKLPIDMELPVYLKEPNEFGDFYKAMFTRQVEKQDGRVVFLEYAWDMSWCDPCAADPLSNDELRRLGVFWSDGRRQPASERVPLAVAHPLRQRALPRRSRVPGNRRSPEFPGALRAASFVDGQRQLQRGDRVSTGAFRPARARGRSAGPAHRVEHRGYPEEDRSGASGSPRTDVVGKTLEEVIKKG